MQIGRGFVILPSYYEALRNLPDDTRLSLYDAMLDFGFTGKEPDNLNAIEMAIFSLMRPNIESSVEKYEAQYKNGCKGGRPKKANENPSETQIKPNGNREKEKELEKETDKDKELEIIADKPPRAPRFVPPTVEEVRAYCHERNSGVDPQRFVDYYTANGWTQGRGKPIKDWQAAVRTWERNGYDSKGSGNPFLDIAREEGLV